MSIRKSYMLLLVFLWNCQEKSEQAKVQVQTPSQVQAQVQTQVQQQEQTQVQEQVKTQVQVQVKTQVQEQVKTQVQEQVQTQEQVQVQVQDQVQSQPQEQVQVKEQAQGQTQDAELQTFDIHNHEIWELILAAHVSEAGRVDYARLKKDRSDLDQYLKQLEENPVQGSWSRSQKLAYWINAYNAFTVDLILDHYPLESIRDINRPWGKKFIKLGDELYSLNQIEHDIIRPVFKEPRIHFAVVCAAVSCPSLLNEAYLPKTLDQQLDAKARYFINQSGKNQLSADQVKISQLFNWYGEDFKQQGSIIDYLNKYSTQKISANAKVDFLEYDWGLND